MIRSLSIAGVVVGAALTLGTGIAAAAPEPAQYAPINNPPIGTADDYQDLPGNEAGSPTIRLSLSQTELVANLTRGLPNTPMNIGGYSVRPNIVAYYTDVNRSNGFGSTCSQLLLIPPSATSAPGAHASVADVTWEAKGCRP